MSNEPKTPQKKLIERKELLSSPNASETVSPNTSIDLTQDNMIQRAIALSDISRKQAAKQLAKKLALIELGEELEIVGPEGNP